MNILFEFYLILSLSSFILSQSPDSRLEPNLNISIPYTGNDPDKKLCENLYIDAAVRADDGIDYIFNDDYYWQMNANYTLSPKFAEPINKRWPQLPTPLDAAFTLVDKNSQLSTIFIQGNQWFLYKKSQQLAVGNTKDWDRFPNVRVKAAFTYFNSPEEPNKNPVYFLYNIGNYIKYDTQDINHMKYNVSSKTMRTGPYFYFLQDNINITTITLDSYLTNISAVLSNPNDILFFGVEHYCRGNITEGAPECTIYSLNELFNCPRMARPTTTTSTTTATIPEIVNSSTSDGSVFESTLNNSTESQTNFNTTQPKSENEKSSHNNNIWFIIILIIVVIVIICLVVFFAIKIFKKNKTNSSIDKSSSNSSKGNANKGSVKSTADSNSESVDTSLKKTSKLKDDTQLKSLKSQTESDKPEKAMSTKSTANETDQTIEKLKT